MTADRVGRGACVGPTSRCLDRVDVEEELQLDMTDPDFILRNIDLASSSCGHVAAIAEGYAGRSEVQRLMCSQSLFVAGLLPFLFERMADVGKKAKTMALNGPLVGIIGAGGQLGSAVTQNFLDSGWSPFRLAVCGRGEKKLKRFEAQGVGVFDNVAVLVRAVKLVIVAVGPQHARQVGSMLGEAGMASRLVLSTLAGISEASLRRVLKSRHLLQTRVDMAELEAPEMGEGIRSSGRGAPPAPPRSSDGECVSDDKRGDTVAAASEKILHGQERHWQVVHDRAARHFLPDARASKNMFSTIQSFFESQGLEEAQAFQACRVWRLYGPPSKSLANQQQDESSTPTRKPCSGPPMQQHVMDGGKNLMGDEGNDDGGWKPISRIKWPPPDLVRIKTIHSQMLYRSYADALRESGYESAS